MIDPDRRRPLRVCYFGTYRAGYTRNQILLKGLRAHGVDVHECHATLWHGIDDRVATAGGGWLRPRFWLRVVRAYAQLLRAYRRAPAYDVLLVGYPGQFDVYLARLLTWLRRKPLVLDVLMSLHLVAEERGLVARSPFSGRVLFLLEKAGLHLPDRLIMENRLYQRYLSDKYNLPDDRFFYVPHGADDAVYAPRPVTPPTDTFDVVYFGGFLPSHGLDTVIDAARQLADSAESPPVTFHFYGDGPERARIMAAAADLPHCRFHGFVAQATLLDAIAAAHLCLGVFGTTPQAQMTVQNKVWETLALGRPLVSAESPAIRDCLTHGEHAYLVPRADPAALAAAVRALHADPALRDRLAAAGHAAYRRHNRPAAIGATLAQALATLVGNPPPVPARP